MDGAGSPRGGGAEHVLREGSGHDHEHARTVPDRHRPTCLRAPRAAARDPPGQRAHRPARGGVGARPRRRAARRTTRSHAPRAAPRPDGRRRDARRRLPARRRRGADRPLPEAAALRAADRRGRAGAGRRGGDGQHVHPVHGRLPARARDARRRRAAGRAGDPPIPAPARARRRDRRDRAGGRSAVPRRGAAGPRRLSPAGLRRRDPDDRDDPAARRRRFPVGRWAPPSPVSRPTCWGRRRPTDSRRPSSASPARRSAPGSRASCTTGSGMPSR